MSTYTKEQLIARINQVTAINKYRISRDPAADGLAMDNELLAIALASLEAEPVCVIDQSNLDYLNAGSDADVWPESRTEMGDVLLYRTAHPAPVSVPDEHNSVIAEQLAHVLSGMDVTDHQRSIINCAVDRLNKNAEVIQQKPAYSEVPEVLGYQGAKELFNYLMNEEETNATVNGWNACRAAMLQGAEHVTTNYKLPFEQWLSQQTGTIDVECGCVMTEVFFHWLRVAYEAGNSPVVPDGWVMVPKQATPEMINSAMCDNETGGVDEIYELMIAAAPQQEVK
jgi:hypothetical protein